MEVYTEKYIKYSNKKAHLVNCDIRKAFKYLLIHLI